LPICLCYDNEHSRDGIGAQVLRIIQVYCLSRELGLGFVNRNILHFDSAPTDSFDFANPRNQYYKKVRDYLQFDRYSCQEEHTVHYLNNSRFFTISILLKLWVIQRNWRSKFIGSHELWVVKNPYGLTIRKPNTLRHFYLSRLPLKNFNKPEEVFNIQLHIRRAAISKNIHSERFTATDWYRKILTEITKALDLNKYPYKITIHTDVAHADLKISTSGISKESLAYSKTRGLIVNADNTITLEYENFLNSLSSFKNISIVTDINPIDAWTMMQSADVLILARSTFSIIPALLIQDGTVISPIGFFRGPREWIYLDDSAELSLQNIRRIIDKRITLTQS